ncbi:hypothetical protein E3U55_16370 [Filobacillus milosensis]|uniref:Uncharacterized protein n=1 Tax=Filobacillus milosensis TaxID=94137 RepID=A0A4Y8IBR8_9BACI|nr:hypothetical protein [Filobacillus milosensis]TFB13304.1 hypothetical protein E3U55_16370 [Filobacillus milosensis]
MIENFSFWSICLVIIGLFLAIEPFSPLNLPFITNWYGVLVGAIIYLIGFVLSLIAIVRQEKGVTKYISLASMFFAIYCVVTLFINIGRI